MLAELAEAEGIVSGDESPSEGEPVQQRLDEPVLVGETHPPLRELEQLGETLPQQGVGPALPGGPVEYGDYGNPSLPVSLP